MRTSSSSNLPDESSPNLTSSITKRRNRRRSKQPFILEESLVDTMADQRTMAELLRAPTEGYAEEIVVPPILAEQFELKHSLINMMTSDQFFGLKKDNPHDHIRCFIELHQLDTFYNALNPADQDSLNFATGGNMLERRTQDVLTIIENKSKVCNSRNISIVSQVKSSDANSSSSSEIAKLTHAVNQQTSACLATDGNTFSELRNNIQGYVSAAAVNYNQADFVIVDYESDPRVLLILGRPFLWTARALIEVHGEEMILRDDDERLTLSMRHDTSNYSNQPQKESINMINIYDDSCEDFLEDLFVTNHLSGNPTFSSHLNLTSLEVKDDIFDPEGDVVLIEKLINLDSTKDLPPPHNINPLSGSTTSSSPNHLLEEFADELALITFPPKNDDLSFDIESDLKEI
nr:reverse transcriptase domain-containing protein [Tanacetum cinerariifolium]